MDALVEPRSKILDVRLSWDDHIVSSFQKGYHSDDLSVIPQLPGVLQPGVTVAVCTYERAESLSRFLDSLSTQDRRTEQLVIVDASRNDTTERMLRGRQDVEALADRVLYIRVSGPLKGLTRQRNFALRWASCGLVAYFDDDIVLDPTCLSEMLNAHTLGGEDVVGVAAYIEDRGPRMTWLMRQRLLFRVIPNSKPGKYHPSGVSVGWILADPSDEQLESDWISGGVAMWNTAVARDEAFCESFKGYSPGEDLEFSLRMSKRGRLVMACGARVKHFHESSGRPNHYTHGYMGIYNLYRIHRQEFPGRYLAWFTYTWILDTVFLMRHFLFPGRIRATLQHILGRLAAAFDIVVRRQSF